MPKNENQRLKLLAVKQILEEYTDIDHGITMDRLLDLLSMRDIVADRRSVYADIDILIKKQGMKIQKPHGTTRIQLERTIYKAIAFRYNNLQLSCINSMIPI